MAGGFFDASALVSGLRRESKARVFFMARSPRDQRAFFRRAWFEVQDGNGGASRLKELCAAHSKTEWPAHNFSNAPRLLRGQKENRKEVEMEIMPVARVRGQAAGEEWVLSDKVGIFDFYGSLRYKLARAKDSHAG